MGHFRMIQVLWRVVPFDSRASVRLRSHIEQCEKCRQSLASLDEARAATLAEDRLPEERDLWPRLVDEMKSEHSMGQRRRPESRRRWAFAAAGVLIVVLGGVLFIRPPQRQPQAGPLVKLRIDSVTIYGQPAQAFVFQTQDAGSTFVWVEKQSSN
jgi:anti-sigma factor RsiW